jgi:hypothetical protein
MTAGTSSTRTIEASRISATIIPTPSRPTPAILVW